MYCKLIQGSITDPASLPLYPGRLVDLLIYPGRLYCWCLSPVTVHGLCTDLLLYPSRPLQRVCLAVALPDMHLTFCSPLLIFLSTSLSYSGIQKTAVFKHSAKPAWSQQLAGARPGAGITQKVFEEFCTYVLGNESLNHCSVRMLCLPDAGQHC